MSELNLGTICSIATAYNQGRTDYTASEASFYANLAQQEVASRMPMRVLESLAISSTTSGENRMSLPTDFEYPIAVSLLTSGNPNYTSQLAAADPLTLDSVGTGLGVPRYYDIYSDWMELAPTPDSNYTLQIRYGAKIQDMIASTDTPSLDVRYHYAIALKTAALLSAARNDSGQEALNLQRYVDYIGSTPNDFALRQRSREGMNAIVQRHRR